MANPYRYLVRIEVWPHSTGRVQQTDLIQAGSRFHDFEVGAASFADACSRADLIAEGIKRNPIVWEAPIVEIRQLHGEERVARYDNDSVLKAAARLTMPVDTSDGRFVGEEKVKEAARGNV